MTVTRSVSRARYISAVDLIVKDIMEEHILRKLPLKDLVRFKSVCKSWYNSVPTIAKSVLGPRQMVRSTLCFRGIHVLDLKTNTGVRQQQSLPLDARGELVGSSNGLLCIRFESNDEHTLVLWNPLIKEHKSVRVYARDRASFLELIGFGYDAFSEDFKIVRIFPDEENNALMQVYSMKTDSWARTFNIELQLQYYFPSNLCTQSDKFFTIYCYRSSIGTLVNGALHWTVRNFDVEKGQVLRFHLTDEKFSLVESPFQFSFNLMVSERNKLCAYSTSARNWDEFEMWGLEEDQDDDEEKTEPKWKQLTQGRRMTKTPPLSYIAPSPLSFMRNGEVLASSILRSQSKKTLGLYNPEEHVLREYYLDEPHLLGKGQACANIYPTTEYHMGEEAYGNLTYEGSIQSLVSHGGKRHENGTSRARNSNDRKRKRRVHKS